ncbi:MAG: MFS transporter [Thermoguttaceae bacterium]|nr:MFS transporter [Thermoguttaceae bacterium]MBR5757149.1 MFS transporter [Thermoguttaceae bacterium]
MSNTTTAAPKVRSDKEYEYWRWRILIGTMIGYIFFYFVRKSITMAMPGLEEIGITKTTLGLFLTIHGVLYGVARFVNGVWSDRVNPRYFMSIGLFLAAMTNVFCGFSSDIATAIGVSSESRANVIAWIIGSFWIINGWVQGMGFPPCAKSLMHWFAPKEHGVKFATWNISHSFGAGLVFLLNSFVVAFGWKFCFLVPACLSILGAIGLYWALRDSPEKEGFDPVEVYYARKHGQQEEAIDAAKAAASVDEEKTSWWADLCKNVFSNWAVWVLCFANFFVYIVRFSILDWAPTFLSQSKGLDLQSAGWATACYEVFGAFGIILSGVLMDKVFKGRGAKACFVYMLGCLIASILFWKLDSGSLVLNILIMSVIGFFIYGPQCLIGCVASTIATKKSGAASSGLTGLFGYLATIVTGFGVGLIVDSATAPFKEARDDMVATAVAGAAEVPGVDAENIRNLGVADLVKALEGVCDSQRSYENFSGDRESYKGQKITEKLQKNQVKLTNAINGLFEGVELTDAQRQKIQDAAMIEAVEGRANISKEGWPLIFGMLVISSFAALILFALIFNAASPELRREEQERKEREAAQKA